MKGAATSGAPCSIQLARDHLQLYDSPPHRKRIHVLLDPQHVFYGIKIRTLRKDPGSATSSSRTVCSTYSMVSCLRRQHSDRVFVQCVRKRTEPRSVATLQHGTALERGKVEDALHKDASTSDVVNQDRTFSAVVKEVSKTKICDSLTL